MYMFENQYKRRKDAKPFYSGVDLITSKHNIPNIPKVQQKDRRGRSINKKYLFRQ